MRCKACNRKLSGAEMKEDRDKRNNGMCNSCFAASCDVYSYTSDHEYEHEHIIDGPTSPKPIEY